MNGKCPYACILKYRPTQFENNQLQAYGKRAPVDDDDNGDDTSLKNDDDDDDPMQSKYEQTASVLRVYLKIQAYIV